jgi:hypothetical protein
MYGDCTRFYFDQFGQTCFLKPAIRFVKRMLRITAHVVDEIPTACLQSLDSVSPPNFGVRIESEQRRYFSRRAPAD